MVQSNLKKSWKSKLAKKRNWDVQKHVLATQVETTGWTIKYLRSKYEGSKG